MKFSRSTSTHLTNLSFRSNNLSTVQTPQNNSRLSEVNNKIEDLLKKSQTTIENQEFRLSSQESKINQQHSFSLVVEQTQKEKKQLLAILMQKDGIIRDQQNKIAQLDLKNKNLMKQLQQFTNLQQKMQHLEEECQQIIKQNEQLKYERNQIQTSLNYLKCQNVQVISYELKNSLQQLHQQIKKYYICSYKEDYYNLEQSRLTLKTSDFDFYTILRECLDCILFMIKNTDHSIELFVNRSTKI
ncbi:unnamed protein product (macronuclear) [Paramecium tetraurelia]|uniref:Uncharacterized protein n=1 Tax=Paramecium tetraurelia TaxID=5888 RepID=A0BKW0_PARTE|nr:uncharacterized protein GSPATT00029808001 [Paramecium tetraurelia]CAK59177.1 unnamed protein product [Paramecium tetraurelia]|eukprot:XP_001426575.1 hypothetical protein (macronuclear) [Paramecium tetraurelia strain d4-2]